MRVKIKGAIEATTSERFHRYIGDSPAHREGWVNIEGVDQYQVTDDYLDPFKEVAANFGLAVEPVAEGQGATATPTALGEDSEAPAKA